MNSYSLIFFKSLHPCMASGHTKYVPSNLFLGDKKIFVFLITDFLRSCGTQYPSASQVLKQMQNIYGFVDKKHTLLWRIMEIFLIFCFSGVLRNTEKVPLLCKRQSLHPGWFGSTFGSTLEALEGSLLFGWELQFSFLQQFPPLLTHIALP